MNTLNNSRNKTSVMSSGAFATNNTTAMSDDQVAELAPLPEYRHDVTKRMKTKLQKMGHRNFGISSDNKQLLVQNEFYKEFIIKMKIMKEIQDEDKKRKLI